MLLEDGRAIRTDDFDRIEDLELTMPESEI
jgi:hypothetical protein